MECSRRIQKLSIVATDGLNLFQQLFGLLEEEELLVILCLAHKIWLRRNTVVFGGKLSSPAHLIQSTTEFLEAFHQAQLDSSNRTGISTRTVKPLWHRPPTGVSKINWDASINTATGKMGVGVIIRDAEGLVLASLCSTLPSITNPTIAEAIAAWKAAELCHAMGLQRVILEGDALTIVQGLQQETPSWCQYGLLLEDTRSILHSLPFWKVTHVCREANGVAHGLAQAALHQSLDCIWYNSYPESIQSLVLAE